MCLIVLPAGQIQIILLVFNPKSIYSLILKHSDSCFAFFERLSDKKYGGMGIIGSNNEDKASTDLKLTLAKIN